VKTAFVAGNFLLLSIENVQKTLVAAIRAALSGCEAITLHFGASPLGLFRRTLGGCHIISAASGFPSSTSWTQAERRRHPNWTACALLLRADQLLSNFRGNILIGGNGLTRKVFGALRRSETFGEGCCAFSRRRSHIHREPSPLAGTIILDALNVPSIALGRFGTTSRSGRQGRRAFHLRADLRRRDLALLGDRHTSSIQDLETAAITTIHRAISGCISRSTTELSTGAVQYISRGNTLKRFKA